MKRQLITNRHMDMSQRIFLTRASALVIVGGSGLAMVQPTNAMKNTCCRANDEPRA